MQCLDGVEILLDLKEHLSKKSLCINSLQFKNTTSFQDQMVGSPIYMLSNITIMKAVKGYLYPIDKLVPVNKIYKKQFWLKTYMKTTVKYWCWMVIFHTQVICNDIIQADGRVPGGCQQQLTWVGAKFHSCNSISRWVLKLKLTRGLCHVIPEK